MTNLLIKYMLLHITVVVTLFVAYVVTCEPLINIVTTVKLKKILTPSFDEIELKGKPNW